MNRPILTLLVLLAFCCTSCLEIEEWLQLRKDGSGQFTISIDMSGMYKDPTAKALLEQGGGETNPLKELGKLDTILNMKAEAMKAGLEKPEFWERVTSSIKANEADSVFIFNFSLQFNQLDEIAYMMQYLPKVGNMAGQGETPGLGAFFPQVMHYALQNGALLRRTEMMAEDKAADPSMSAMFAMMPNANYVLKIDAPSNIKESNISNASTNGKQLKASLPLGDAISGQLEKLDGRIVF